MSTQPSVSYIPPILPAAGDQTAVQAALALGKLLSDMPEYQAFLNALREVNNNAEVQRLSVKIREHNNALQWGKGDLLEHQSATEILQAELESLPSLRVYRQAEEVITHLFHAVDEVISQAAGVPFAANAKRSGCGCGG